MLLKGNLDDDHCDRATSQTGATGPEIFPLALGCMGMSGMYGAADEAESIATIHAAIDAGVNLIDTGDFYGMGHNEMLIGRALRLKRDQVLISVKFGAQRAPDGSWLGHDARPADRENRRSPTRSRGSASTISTSTGRPGSIPRCRSRTRSAPSPT